MVMQDNNIRTSRVMGIPELNTTFATFLKSKIIPNSKVKTLVLWKISMSLEKWL